MMVHRLQSRVIQSGSVNKKKLVRHCCVGIVLSNRTYHRSITLFFSLSSRRLATDKGNWNSWDSKLFKIIQHCFVRLSMSGIRHAAGTKQTQRHTRSVTALYRSQYFHQLGKIRHHFIVIHREREVLLRSFVQQLVRRKERWILYFTLQRTSSWSESIPGLVRA